MDLDTKKVRHRVGDLYSLLPFNKKSNGSLSNVKKEYYLLALFMECGVVERHLAMA